jgi:hypothetical protein
MYFLILAIIIAGGVLYWNSPINSEIERYGSQLIVLGLALAVFIVSGHICIMYFYDGMNPRYFFQNVNNYFSKRKRNNLHEIKNQI